MENELNVGIHMNTERDFHNSDLSAEENVEVEYNQGADDEEWFWIWAPNPRHPFLEAGSSLIP